MTHPAPDAVASGKPYNVVTLGGVTPSSLDQFVGETDFVIDNNGAPSTICGSGILHDQAVRFHEKAGAGSGKDTRTWTITYTEQGSFTAAPEAMF